MPTSTDLKHLEKARAKLRSSNPVVELPGREDKINELETFITEKLKIRQTTSEKKAKVEAGLVANIRDRHSNKTVFVCGVPGTGKTAVVLNVVNKLLKKIGTKGCPIHPFKCIYVNAQHLSTPQKVYSEILYKLTGAHAAPEKAQTQLDKLFLPDQYTTKDHKRQKSSKNDDMFKIVIIDELDLLYSERRQSVFYSLFDWPTTNESKVILITIANAMDLPERFMRGRIGSRLGWNKLVFEPYTSDHLQAILEAHLGKELLKKCFDKTSIIVATKRIGRTTGDARRIIDTCSLAIEEAISEKSPIVTGMIIDRVGFQNLDEMRVNYIKNCPKFELMALKGILNESSNYGEDNIHASGVYNQVTNMLRQSKAFKGVILGHDDFHVILNKLQGVGLVSMEDSKNLMMKRMFIKDTSEIFRDVIRDQKIDV